MKFIIITPEKIIKNEYRIIKSLLDNGVSNIHIRKRLISIELVKQLLDYIEEEYHSRITINGDFSILDIYKKIGAVHTNSNNRIVPKSFKGEIGFSAHTIEEVKDIKDKYDYLFLSPIYNSISKKGYSSTFSYSELKEAFKQGILTEKVYALGGITPNKIPELKELGFGGVAFMGYIWESYNLNEIIKKVNIIKSYL